jgi:site-specific DNA recombinase
LDTPKRPTDADSIHDRVGFAHLDLPEVSIKPVNKNASSPIQPVCSQIQRIRYDSQMSDSPKQPVQALAYLRVSSVGQVEGDGFPRQREAIGGYADKHGIEIVGEYRDEGVSGTTEHGDREGFSEMLTRIAGNCVRLVLVERADRLARDLLVQETLLNSLIKLGVRVVDSAGTDLTDESDPSRILIRQVLGAVAQHDRACLVAKLRKARERMRVAKGRCEGRKPYGTKVGEDRVLERIHALAAEGMTVRGIADTLTSEGFTARGGKPFSFGTVAKVLQRVRGSKQAA